MADPSGLDDLEAELRRMEEELAALKGKKPEKKAKKKDAPPADVAAASAPEAPKKKFGLPKFGKKAEAPLPEPVEAAPAEPVAAEALPAEAAPVAPEPAPAIAPVPGAPHVTSTPSGRWRREGSVWILQNPPREPVHLRRVLDAEGRVVREEPAPRDLFEPRSLQREALPEGGASAPEEASSPASSPAPSDEKPLHSLAEKLGAKRKKGLFGRKKGD